MIYAARSRAVLQGRLTPAIDDVISVAQIVLQHRILISFAAEAESMTPKKIINKIISDLN